jgi:hypothetical protein
MIRAYEVGLRGQDHWTTVHAATAGKAKYSFWMDVRDCLEVKYIDVVSRVADSLFVQTDEFQRTAKYRGVPFARIGMKVMFVSDDSEGIIVDKNSSANFEVYFTSGQHAGLTLGVHPNWMIRYLDDAGNVIKEFTDNE